MRLPALLASLLLIGSLPAAGQEDAPPDEGAGLADEAPAASDPAPAAPASSEDDDEAPANPTYERAPGEGYERHEYGDDDDGYATGRRRSRRGADDGEAEDDRRDDAEDDPRVADDEAGGDEEGGRRRRGEDAAKSSAEPAAAPNPWVGPAVVGLCALGSGCGCLTPLACIGLFPETSIAAAILAAPTLVISAVTGSAVGGLGHLLFGDDVGALPCVVAPIAAFVLAAVFGGLGTVTGLIVGTSTGSDPVGVIAALSVLIPGALATAAGASAAYAGVAFLMAPAEGGAPAGEGDDAPSDEAGAPDAASPGASFEAGPRRPRVASAMVY